MARVGIITGSGTYALPDFVDPAPHDLDTPFGATLVTEGVWADQIVLHVSRHGEGHARLSNHVNHRANVWALSELGADCVIGCTACGAMRATVRRSRTDSRARGRSSDCRYRRPP